MINLKLSLDKRYKRKDDHYSIIIRISHRDKSRDISTGFTCKEIDWDSRYNCIKVTTELLETLHNRLVEQRIKYQERLVPSDTEWMEFELELGMCPFNATECVEAFGERGTVEGKAMKSEAGWNNGDDPTNNNSGFNAFPGGQNEGWGAFFWQIGSGGNFWSSTEFPSNYYIMRRLGDVSSTVLRQEVGVNGSTKSTGKSIRCVKGASDVGLIELNNSKKSLVKIVDLMGRDTNYKTNTALIYVFSDGTTEKIFKIEL